MEAGGPDGLGTRRERRRHSTGPMSSAEKAVQSVGLINGHRLIEISGFAHRGSLSADESIGHDS